jgi:hypothetical protein
MDVPQKHPASFLEEEALPTGKPQTPKQRLRLWNVDSEYYRRWTRYRNLRRLCKEVIVNRESDDGGMALSLRTGSRKTEEKRH